MSITLPPPESSAEHYGYLTIDAALEYAWAYSAAVEADRASRPQTVPDELRAAAAAVTQHWDSPLWKVAQHTGVFIHRLRAALAAVEAEPVAQAQPESAPVRVPMTERELALAMVSVSDVLEFGRWPHHLMPIKDTLIEFARTIELHHGIGSAT